MSLDGRSEETADGANNSVKCRSRGKMVFARGLDGELKEVHLCKNKKIDFAFCETAIKQGHCRGVY